MNIERYLASYESYRDVVLGMQKAARRGNADINGFMPSAGVMAEFMDNEELEREYEKKKRILTHATKRLQRAISRISDPRLSDYLVCKYFYRMTNEEYSEQLGYCVRQVYRIAVSAKKALAKYLKPRRPMARRGIRGERYSFAAKKPAVSHRKYGGRRHS